MAFAHAGELTVRERMEGVGHADKLRRSDGKVCFLWRVTSGSTGESSSGRRRRRASFRSRPAQMAYMLEGIDWRNPQLTWRPKSAG